MRNTCLVIAVVVYCGYVSASFENEGEISLNENIVSCEPNSTKMQDCNRCRCSNNGRLWLCTKKACPKPLRKISPGDPGFACTPNKLFKFECNTCTCNEKGNGASCTDKACIDPSFEKYTLKRVSEADDSTTTTTQPIPAVDKCIPGQRWKDNCNWCFCTDTGIAACTLRGCLNRLDVPTIQTAINHKITKRQTINHYGQTADQDKVYKLEDLNSPDFSCVPSLSFKVDCNTCWCAADGKRPRYCTRIACAVNVNTNRDTTTERVAASRSPDRLESFRNPPPLQEILPIKFPSN